MSLNKVESTSGALVATGTDGYAISKATVQGAGETDFTQVKNIVGKFEFANISEATVVDKLITTEPIKNGDNLVIVKDDDGIHELVASGVTVSSQTKKVMSSLLFLRGGSDDRNKCENDVISGDSNMYYLFIGTTPHNKKLNVKTVKPVYMFGEPKAINMITVRVRNSTSYTERRPTGYKVEGSNDNTSWTTLSEDTIPAWTQFEIKEFPFTNSTLYKYYRMSFIGTSSSIEITDIGLYDLDNGSDIRDDIRFQFAGHGSLSTDRKTVTSSGLYSSFGVSETCGEFTGKVYAEYSHTHVGNSSKYGIFITFVDMSSAQNGYNALHKYGWRSDGVLIKNDSNSTNTGIKHVTGSRYGLEYDFSTKTLSFYNNGVKVADEVTIGSSYPTSSIRIMIQAGGSGESSTLYTTAADLLYLPSGTSPLSPQISSTYILDTTATTQGEVPTKAYRVDEKVSFNDVEAVRTGDVYSGTDPLLSNRTFSNTPTPGRSIETKVNLSAKGNKMTELSAKIWKDS